MQTIHSSLYAMAIATCVVCMLLLKGGLWKANHQSWAYFAAFLLLEVLGFIFEWLLLHPASPAKSLWLGLLMALSLWVAPCLWLFAKALTETQATAISKLHRGHLLVIGVGILLTLPLMQVAHWGPGYANPDTPTSAVHSWFIHATMLACGLLFCCQVPFYLNRCVTILAAHRAHHHASLSPVSLQGLMVLRMLMAVTAISWIVSTVRIFQCFLVGEDTGIIFYYTAAEVVVTLTVLVAIARHATQLKSTEPGLAPAAVPGGNIADTGIGAATPVAIHTSVATPAAIPVASPVATAVKYGHSPLNAATRGRIQRKLDQAFNQQQVYRDSQLSLGRLAALLREKPHYVSQVINQELASNFYDLVNQHRIAAARVALLEQAQRSVTDIALEVGFNSKSTFNAAFRRHTEMTPSQYRTGGLPQVSYRIGSVLRSGPTGLDAGEGRGA